MVQSPQTAKNTRMITFHALSSNLHDKVHVFVTTGKLLCYYEAFKICLYIRVQVYILYIIVQMDLLKAILGYSAPLGPNKRWARYEG